MSVRIDGLENFDGGPDDPPSDSTDSERRVSFSELFTDGFMRTHTDFGDIDEFFGESPWAVEDDEDFEQLPVGKFDSYVARHSGFDSWDSMLSAAAREWILQRRSE
jgi:hypothetical protein